MCIIHKSECAFFVTLSCPSEDTFAKKLEEKRFECERIFFKELEEDKMKWKQTSDQIIYDLM